MDFERAKSIGDVAERAVAEELARLAPRYGLIVLNDVLLEINGKLTAQLDHIIIDRYGVLVLEAKVRNGALIKGSHTQPRWTACYGAGRNKTFQSPLDQSRWHEEVVAQVLDKAGQPLDLDYLKSAVVFAGADLSDLKLDSLHRARVVSVQELEGLIRQRHEFAMNAGDLSSERIAVLSAILRALDQSHDPEVVERHAAYRRGDAPQGKPSKEAATATSAQRPTAQPTRQRPVAQPKPRGEVDVTERAAVAFTRELGSGSRRTVVSGCDALLARTALALLMLLALWWLFLGPGMPILGKFLVSGFRTDAPPASTAPAQTVSVERALEVLGEAAPEKVPALVNRTSPLVTQVPEGTTFTWEYVVSNENVAQVSTISITLDASGNLVGVDIP